MKRTICCFLPLFMWGVFVQKSFAEGTPPIPPETSRTFPELMKKMTTRLTKEFGQEYVSHILPRLEIYTDTVLRNMTAREAKDRLRRIKEEYEKNVVSRDSLHTGSLFLHAYWDFLKDLQRKTGVDPYASITMLRIETNFGAVLGGRPVLNNLYSLYLLSPRPARKRFALRQMLCFIRTARENGWEPFSIKGSWAGAFGLPQFIPCTYRANAVDGDDNGTIDLFHVEDSLASAAYLLKECGWARNKRRALLCYNGWDFYARLALKYRKILRVYYAKQKRRLAFRK